MEPEIAGVRQKGARNTEVLGLSPLGAALLGARDVTLFDVLAPVSLGKLLPME